MQIATVFLIQLRNFILSITVDASNMMDKNLCLFPGDLDVSAVSDST